MASDWTILSNYLQGDISYDLQVNEVTRSYVDFTVVGFGSKWREFDVAFEYRISSGQTWMEDAVIIESTCKYMEDNKMYCFLASIAGSTNSFKWQYSSNSILFGTVPQVRLRFIPREYVFGTPGKYHTVSRQYGWSLNSLNGISRHHCVGIDNNGRYMCVGSKVFYLIDSLDDEEYSTSSQSSMSSLSSSSSFSSSSTSSSSSMSSSSSFSSSSSSSSFSSSSSSSYSSSSSSSPSSISSESSSSLSSLSSPSSMSSESSSSLSSISSESSSSPSSISSESSSSPSSISSESSSSPSSISSESRSSLSSPSSESSSSPSSVSSESSSSLSSPSSVSSESSSSVSSNSSSSSSSYILNWSSSSFSSSTSSTSSTSSSSSHPGDNSSSSSSGGLGVGLLLHYKMNDNAANTTVVDSVGTSNGTVAVDNTSTMTQTGKINASLQFDATTDTIIDSNYVVSEQSFTISFWWYRRSGSYFDHIVACAQSSAVQEGFIIYDYSAYASVIGCYMSKSNAWWNVGGGGLQTTVTTTADQWCLIQLTYNGSTGLLSFFVNGNADNTQDQSADKTITYDGGTLRISWPDNYPAYGRVDDFRFYNRVLTTTELRNIWNNGNGTEKDT